MGGVNVEEELRGETSLLNARLHIKQLLDREDGDEVIQDVASQFASSDATPAATVGDVLAFCIREYAHGERVELLARGHGLEYEVLATAIGVVAERAVTPSGD